MMMMFRLVRDGRPVFYELGTLVEQEGSLTLRLKHFNSDLAGWEEKETSVDFPLVAVEDGVLHFDGMSMHRHGESGLTVILAIQKQDGTVSEETFSYARPAQ